MRSGYTEQVVKPGFERPDVFSLASATDPDSGARCWTQGDVVRFLEIHRPILNDGFTIM